MADNKKFQNVDILKELAASMPTQRAPEPPREVVVMRPAPAAPSPQPPSQPAAAPEKESSVQISFSARFSTRKRMFQVARELDITLKALILGALREKYPTLGIVDEDLIDLRANHDRR